MRIRVFEVAVLTNLDEVPVPSGLLDHLTKHDRSVVAEQSIDIKPHWWTDQLQRHSLPGGPVTADGTTSDNPLRRAAVQRFGPPAGTDPDAALRLLWHALAWGAGHRLRLCAKRVDSIATLGARHSGLLLQHAAALAGPHPVAAYEALAPRGRPAIRFLGPAFFTKYLYFAGGGAPDHPCLILDARVAAALHRHGWTSLPTRRAGWPTHTYCRYLTLVQRWCSVAADEIGRSISGDEIEFWLWREGGAPTNELVVR